MGIFNLVFSWPDTSIIKDRWRQAVIAGTTALWRSPRDCLGAQQNRHLFGNSGARKISGENDLGQGYTEKHTQGRKSGAPGAEHSPPEAFWHRHCHRLNKVFGEPRGFLNEGLRGIGRQAADNSGRDRALAKWIKAIQTINIFVHQASLPKPSSRSSAKICVGLGFVLAFFGCSAGKASTVEKEATPPLATASSQLEFDEQKFARVKMGDQVLTIPRAYIMGDGFSRDFDFVRIALLLPCFEPRTPENAHEFFPIPSQNFLWVDISTDSSIKAGIELLHIWIENKIPWKIIKEYDTDDGKFHVYDERMRDVFVHNNKNNELFFDCNKKDTVDRAFGFPSPSCHRIKRIWGGILIEYHFKRHYVGSAEDIDSSLDQLLESFRDGNNASSSISSLQGCRK